MAVFAGRLQRALGPSAHVLDIGKARRTGLSAHRVPRQAFQRDRCRRTRVSNIDRPDGGSPVDLAADSHSLAPSPAVGSVSCASGSTVTAASSALSCFLSAIFSPSCPGGPPPISFAYRYWTDLPCQPSPRMTGSSNGTEVAPEGRVSPRSAGPEACCRRRANMPSRRSGNVARTGFVIAPETGTWRSEAWRQ